MVITITHPSKNQWAKIGKVIMWLTVSAFCAAITAYITNNPLWLASLPGWNIFGVLLQQFLTQEEQTALNNIPADIRQPVNQVITPTIPSNGPVQ